MSWSGLAALGDALEAYFCDRNLGLDHLTVLADAIKEAQAAYVKAARKSDWDAMMGAATRLDRYASKLQDFTNKLGSAR